MRALAHYTAALARVARDAYFFIIFTMRFFFDASLRLQASFTSFIGFYLLAFIELMLIAHRPASSDAAAAARGSFLRRHEVALAPVPAPHFARALSRFY